MGSAGGYLSVLVLALYINSREVTELYTYLDLLWAACLPLLYWMTRIWFLAYSGCINDSPIVFTVKDGTSYTIVPMIVLIMIQPYEPHLDLAR